MTAVLTASIPSPAQSSFDLGPLTIHAYGVIIGIGVLVGFFMLDRRYRRRGGPEEVPSAALIFMLLGGIIGARVYHVVTLPEAYFGPGGDPVRALYFWQGGLGIMGAVAGGGLAAWLYLRYRGLRLAPFADAVAPALLVAQGIGRWGNWFNQELYGRPTSLPWGLEIDDQHLPPGAESGTLFHPTFLYESLWNVLGAIALIYLDRRFRLTHGRLFALYVIWYALGRNVTEALRIDQTVLYVGLRVNQVFAIGILLLGIVLLWWTSRLAAQAFARQQGDPIYLPGREPREEDGAGGGPDGRTAAATEAQRQADVDSWLRQRGGAPPAQPRGSTSAVTPQGQESPDRPNGPDNPDSPDGPNDRNGPKEPHQRQDR